MILNENHSQKDSFDEFYREKVVDNQKYELQDKNENNLVIDDTYDNLSYLDIAWIVIKQSIIMVLLTAVSTVRLTLLFVFSKNIGTEFLTVMSLVLPLYSIFQFGIPWATTQYYGYEASKFYSEKRYINLGLITNKVMVINISLSIFFTICFYSFIPFILSHFLETQQSIDQLYSISRYLGISMPFQYWQFCLVIYFMSIEYFYHLPFGQVIGLGVQILFQVIIVIGFKKDLIGIGISYAIGNICLVTYNTIFYLFKNKLSNFNIPIRFDETFDNMFSDYIPNSFFVGLVVFLNLLSLEITPIISIIIYNTKEFTTIGIILNFFFIITIFNEAISNSNNFMLNRCIGRKQFKLFKSVIFVTVVIISIYTAVVILLLLIFLDNIMTLYTNDQEIINCVEMLKYSFLFMILSTAFITVSMESLAVFEEYKTSLVNLICFRYIGTIVISIIAHKFWNWGINSLFLSFSINNIFMTIINFWRLMVVISKYIEDMKKKAV